MKILVCHDGPDPAQSTLEKTIVMPKWARPEIVVVTVPEEPADTSSYNEDAFEDWRATWEAELKKKTASWVAGLDNRGSSLTAITVPFLALTVLDSWRWAIALSGMAMVAYGFYSWFAITNGPVGTNRSVAMAMRAPSVSPSHTPC